MEKKFNSFAIGFGSNLGERERNLDRALEMIDALPNTIIRAASSLYRSEPWGDFEQPEFRNAVALGFTGLSARELLHALQEIESRLGKKVMRKWGPRVIDLDILLYEESQIAESGLTVPHPHIQSRPFVYLPLAECLSRAPSEFPPSWRQFTGSDEGRKIEVQTGRLNQATSYWPASFSSSRSSCYSESEVQTARMGEALGRAACPGDIFGLIGPLGAGKSCFARGIARGLDVTGPVPSPTFTLCREYPAARLLFHHWDFYRLQDAEELESTAFTDSLDSGAVIAAEWADLFRAELPAKRTTWIHVDRLEDENRRRVRIEFAPGSLALRRAWAEETGGQCEA